MRVSGAPSSAVVPAGWDELLAADPSATPAHRPALWRAFADAMPGHEWRVLEHREQGVLIGGMPIVVERRGPFTWLHALPMLLPGAPLARPGQHARVDAALAEAFAALARETGAVGGEWSFQRAEGPAPEPGVLEALPGETRRLEAGLLRLRAGTEPLHAAMDRKQRQALERVRARGHRFAEEPEALDEAWALHLGQSRRWSGHRPLPIELSRRLLATRDAAGEPAARLFTLRTRGGELASATLALDGAHETFAWWSGTHPHERRGDASLLLLWSVAEWAAAHGRSRFNLGASAGVAAVAAFKRSLAAEGLAWPVRWIAPAHASWSGRVLAALQSWKRRGRARGSMA